MAGQSSKHPCYEDERLSEEADATTVPIFMVGVWSCVGL